MIRCDWSDLPTDQCDHCGAHPGTRLGLEPPRPSTGAVATDEEATTLPRPKLPADWAPSSDAGECRCGKPTRDDTWLCDDCQDEFTLTLADLGALDEELVVTITRQRAAATTGGPRSATTPLPWHEGAGDARRALHGLLVSWVRLCAEEDVKGPQIAFPADSIPSLAAWLATRVHGLALHDAGPDAMDEITDAAAECHRIVFWKRKSRIYLGTCGKVTTDEDGNEYDPCPGEVYADEDEPVGHCDLCREGATVVVKRSAMEAELDTRLYTAAEIARLSTFLGLDAPRDQVRKRVLYWHRHKLVEQRGTNAEGHPMFRYGEVRGRLYADFAQRAS